MKRPIEDELQINRPLGSLARELVLNLYRTEVVLTAALEEVLRPVELHLDEYNVLRILRGAGEAGADRAAILQRMVHAPDRLLAIFHRLKSRGLAEGVHRMTATAAGLELLASIDPAFEGAIEARVAGIPAERIQVAIEVMEQIRRAEPTER